MANYRFNENITLKEALKQIFTAEGEVEITKVVRTGQIVTFETENGVVIHG